MKIAAITVTYNDGYKLEEWYNYYLEYKDELHKIIIVDNGSESPYLNKVKTLFSDSIIIERTVNGGMTAAYNEGIRIALADPEIDSILLLANDFKLEKNGIPKLYRFLMSNEHYGIVSPVVLQNNSEKVESVGCYISWSLYLKEPHVGELLSSIKQETFMVDTVAGGLNLARRELYETIGLQDEELFMYSDEADLGLRIKQTPYKVAVTKDMKVWHQHINPKERSIRLPYSAFLIGRNKIYLAYKHFGFLRAFLIFSLHMYKFLIGLITGIKSKEKIQFQFFFFVGSICGVLRIKKNFNFILNN